MTLRVIPWRKVVLAVALMATVAATVWMSLSDEDDAGTTVSAARTSRGPRAKTSATAQRLELESLQRPSQVVETNREAFPVHSWTPPPAAAAPAPPVAPTAPPLPFSYAGQMVDGKVVTVYLLRGTDSLSVTTGDTFMGTYRVDEIQPRKLVLTYLPLMQQQTLPIGELN